MKYFSLSSLAKLYALFASIQANPSSIPGTNVATNTNYNSSGLSVRPEQYTGFTNEYHDAVKRIIREAANSSTPLYTYSPKDGNILKSSSTKNNKQKNTLNTTDSYNADSICADQAENQAGLNPNDGLFPKMLLVLVATLCNIYPNPIFYGSTSPNDDGSVKEMVIVGENNTDDDMTLLSAYFYS